MRAEGLLQRFRQEARAALLRADALKPGRLALSGFLPWFRQPGEAVGGECVARDVGDDPLQAADAARRIAQSLCDDGARAVFLGSVVQQHPDAAGLHALAQELSRLTGATLVGVATIRVTGVDVSTRSQAAVVAQRALHFEDQPDGSVRDSVLYSILATEWPDVKRHLELRLNRR